MTELPTPRVHVVGAGLAGLAAGVRLAGRGLPVEIYEAAGHAGGRCRSYFDPFLERTIDNGNHLLLSGNPAAMEFLETVGSREAMHEGSPAEFPFYDLKQGVHWSLRLSPGVVPWWVVRPGRRVPGTRVTDYLSILRLAKAGPQRSVADAVGAEGPLYERFWLPLTLAVLNTTPEHASANLLWAVMKETVAKGERYSRPIIAERGLGDALIDPAVRYIEQRGGKLYFGARLRELALDKGRVVAAKIGGKELKLSSAERLILALPPSRLGQVLPEMQLPDDRSVIVNAHFRLPRSIGGPRFLGLLNATAHWAFVREDVISVTISAADRLGLADCPEDSLLAALWPEMQAAFGLEGQQYMAARLIRERRATFDQSPTALALRPEAKTELANVYLAGDATGTGIPATIEGAIRSGFRAADLAAERLTFP
ncbi:MAG TPA: hydroxysqualene dehydroxylase HpnE [Alphaproteobacteria bacterium]|nr:hydroxysqualene dehydroxylase HpnE [Alphaproteobacteria bacterium]